MARALFSILLLLTTASAASAPAARPLPFFYDLYTFRGRGGSTAVVASMAVPAGRLMVEKDADEVRYRFDVTLVLADTALGTVHNTHDSVVVHFPDPPEPEHLVYTHIAVQAPPSRATVQRVIMFDATTPGIGQLYYSAFPIPDYGGTRLVLSDIALAQPAGESGWKRGGNTLALLPADLLPGSMFDLYYEIYNLPFGHPYDTAILFEPVDSAGVRIAEREDVTIRFSGQSAADDDNTLPELRRVETALADGYYRITVTITDRRNGQVASRSRRFQVGGWPWGATPAPAMH